MTAPLVPPEIDLRDFAYMPLDVVRLRDSDLAAVSSGDGFRAAVLLWCASWHQVPAASVPTDDRVLARLAGYGRDVSAWLEVREDALRGFVECADGRLYHPVVAEKAREAWTQKIRQRERTGAARQAKAARASRPDRDETVDATEPVVKTVAEPVTEIATEPVTEAVAGSKGTERNGTEKKESSSLRSDDSKENSKRGSRLPSDWRPNDEGRRFAVEKLGGGRAAHDELASFVDFWTAKAGADARKMDWEATWRNWVRKAAEKRSRAGPNGSHAPKTNLRMDVAIESINDERNGITIDRSIF